MEHCFPFHMAFNRAAKTQRLNHNLPITYATFSISNYLGFSFFGVAYVTHSAFHGLTGSCSNQSGDHGPSGPSPLPQHTRLCQPLIEGLGVHQSTREDITQGAGEPSVSCVSTAGDVFFPPVANQPGRSVQPAAAADPIAALEARVPKESRFVGELYRARFVPQSPRSPAGGAAGSSVQAAGRRSLPCKMMFMFVSVYYSCEARSTKVFLIIRLCFCLSAAY